MDEITLKALKSSIEHWTRLATGTEGREESINSTDCALCQIFNSGNEEEVCVGCPVMDKTQTTNCMGSPWSAAAVAWSRMRKDKDTLAYPYSSALFMERARAELEFLQSLLPPEESAKEEPDAKES